MTIATVVHGLEHHAAARPRAPAVVAPGRIVTFGELHARVAGCSGWLRSQGIEHGDVVGLTVADELVHIVVMLSLASIGAAQVVMPTRDGAAARSRLAERVVARRVVAMRDEHRLPGLDTILLDPERAASWTHVPREPLHGPDPTTRLTYFMSSGTTGEAKIIPLRHDEFMLQAGRSRVGRVLSMTSIEHAIARRQLLYAVIHGTSVAVRGDSHAPVAHLCAELGVDIIAGAAARAKDLMDEAATHGRLPPRTELTAAGLRTTAVFRRQLLARVCDAVQVTYSTQESGSVSRTVERSAGEATDTVGKPHPGVDVEVVDAEGRVLPSGEVGEIRIRAPGVARSYLDDDAANARHFRDGWFMPGDLASLTPEGAIVIHGRADDVMNLNGIKIAPLEIERVLERHPAVRTVVAFPLRSPVHGEVPVAAVELADGARVDERELARYARDALGLRAPRRVMIVEALPSTANGKVDVPRLVALAQGSRER